MKVNQLNMLCVHLRLEGLHPVGRSQRQEELRK